MQVKQLDCIFYSFNLLTPYFNLSFSLVDNFKRKSRMINLLIICDHTYYFLNFFEKMEENEKRKNYNAQ